MNLSKGRLMRFLAIFGVILGLGVLGMPLQGEIRQGSDGKNYSNSRTIRFVPQIQESGPAETQKVELYVSEDDGESWKKYAETENPEDMFTYEASHDGLYLFSTVAVDSIGQKEALPKGPQDAELEVIIDTTAPRLKANFNLLDLDAKPRDIKNLFWKVTDANPIDHVHIAFFDPGPQSWSTIARIRNSQTYALEIPDFRWETFRVRMQAYDVAGNPSDPVDLDFKLGARVVYPVSSISIPQTSRDLLIEMILSSEGLGETEFSHYEVYYTPDKSQTWLLAGTTKTGRMEWKVPRDGHYGFYSVAVDKTGIGEPLPQSGDLPKVSCLVDTKAPELKLDQPQGGERYTHDRPLAISWHGIENFVGDDPVKVSYSPDDGITWQNLASGPLTGRYLWNLTGFSGHHFRVKLTLEDKVGHLVEKISDTFAIGPLNEDEQIQFNSHFKKANALRAVGRWSEALEEYRDVLKYDVNYAPAHNDMGVVFTQLKRWNEAIDSFQRASMLDEDNGEYLFNLGISMYYNDMPGVAEDTFLKLLEKDPDNARACWYISEIRALNKDIPGSKIYLEKILQINDPRNQLKPLARRRLQAYP